MKSEREKLYEKIEAIGGMEALDAIADQKGYVPAQKDYGGYEPYEDQWECVSREEVMQKAKMESNAEYFDRMRTEEVQSQKVKADAGKIRLSLVPPCSIEAIAKVREFAVKKYGADSWRQVEAWRFEEAMYRHALEYQKNHEAVDAESGLPHIWHVACNAALVIALRELEPCK